MALLSVNSNRHCTIIFKPNIKDLYNQTIISCKKLCIVWYILNSFFQLCYCHHDSLLL